MSLLHEYRYSALLFSRPYCENCGRTRGGEKTRFYGIRKSGDCIIHRTGTFYIEWESQVAQLNSGAERKKGFKFI